PISLSFTPLTIARCLPECTLDNAPTCSHYFSYTNPPTTEIYTLSLHDALPICCRCVEVRQSVPGSTGPLTRSSLVMVRLTCLTRDRKSTRLNSSHVKISYAVFCLKKKKKKLGDARASQAYSSLLYTCYDM